MKTKQLFKMWTSERKKLILRNNIKNHDKKAKLNKI